MFQISCEFSASNEESMKYQDLFLFLMTTAKLENICSKVLEALKRLISVQLWLCMSKGNKKYVSQTNKLKAISCSSRIAIFASINRNSGRFL